MPGAATEIGDRVIPAEIEGRHDLRRRYHSLSVHAAKKHPHGLFSTKEVIEKRSIETESLVPTMGAFADGILEVSPQRIRRHIGEADVAAKRYRAAAEKICLGDRRIAVGSVTLLQQFESGAGIQ